jgi:hypothetical protein
MVSPNSKRGADLTPVSVPIIDRFDAAFDVIDRKLGNVWRDA